MNKYFILVLKVIVAIILLQTLFFKFSGSVESVYIFEKLGMEPIGRIGSGIVELIASILLFINKTRFYAALTVVGTMFGAIISHIFILGIEVMNDGGTLFILALITLVFSSILAIIFVSDLKKLNNKAINSLLN
ncbi:DoxX family protein [Flavobacterium sp. F372]|jgi:putative oxidoreductase|uniref:DoxX family protein n=1 Tax=Flavobacterium bernardetii TaxID=2813823 RepID=A0ABR7IWC1_9FLAO|nr:DoxX family membrane protein [Flavobacterium bernardetii]MBC5834071.1 DoxX family protein [Flavobacterium bernardetii]NHF69303.1 DoxX family protein [Flavobacterium bernardetii]